MTTAFDHVSATSPITCAELTLQLRSRARGKLARPNNVVDDGAMAETLAVALTLAAAGYEGRGDAFLLSREHALAMTFLTDGEWSCCSQRKVENQQGR